MKDIYAKNTANYPRLKTDVMFANYDNTYKYDGFVDKYTGFIEDFQLLRADIWKRFTDQFTFDSDFNNGWKGEYWGKMMRGACLVYSYTKNQELYDILTQTVKDIINTADEDGRISSYGKDHEFQAWDMWCRKYVLLGLQYFMEICNDDVLCKKIIETMEGHADYIIGKIGNAEDGKTPICATSDFWRGLNSSSILEPIVRLYSITGKTKYFEFAKYITDIGGTNISNLITLAFNGDMYPYQYPVTKAYEMTSFFEGVLEFYRVSGDEKYKTAVINYADKLLESDFTVIGCAGCTHELFDHSTVRQANTTNGEVAQETCVTVTLMKFLYQMTLLTGDTKYIDAFEISFYNAYLGSVNNEKIIDPSIIKNHPDWNFEPLPFDSYSPLTAGRRGIQVGGLQKMEGNYYYGCCACIGSAGIGLVPKMQLLATEKGFALNLYINGSATSKTPSGKDIVFETQTGYPKDGHIKIVVKCQEEESFELKLRNPAWSKTTSVMINGEKAEAKEGYVIIDRKWQNGDTIEAMMDMRTEALSPIPYGSDIIMNDVQWEYHYVVPHFDKEDPEAKNHIALRRGPLMLAQDNRLGYNVDDAVSIDINTDGYVDVKIPQTASAPYETIAEFEVPLSDGSMMTVTDYASAGKLWTDESKMAVWIKTTEKQARL